MELSVTQENLSKALNGVGRVAGSKTALPILNNILLRTDKNRLFIAATNLEIAATYFIGAKVVKAGAVTVPARLLAEFVSNLPKGTVDLKLDGRRLMVSSGRFQSYINSVEADDFPELPVINESSAKQFSLAGENFKRAITQTIITTSNDSSRPVLTGVYWHIDKDKLYLVATDGYRLAEKFLEKVDNNNLSAIVPAVALSEVIRLIGDETDLIDVLFDDSQVRFRLGDAEITSRLIDGKYPDYKQLIPASNETSVEIDLAEFSRLTKIASLFARESGGAVTITTDEDAGTVSLHSIASEFGENTSSAEAKITGSGSITLNSRYLSEALSVINAPSVKFGFNGKLSPCLITAADDTADYRHIIMPLKS